MEKIVSKKTKYFLINEKPEKSLNDIEILKILSKMISMTFERLVYGTALVGALPPGFQPAQLQHENCRKGSNH